MELFTITRYSESGEIQKEPLPEQEDKLLEKLLKKAKKRKLVENEIENATEEITDKIYQEKSEEQKVDIAHENENIKNSEDIQTEQTNDKIEFQVLGDDVFQQRKKVQMVLPSWLAYPTIISANITENIENQSIEDLHYLSPKIVDNLKKMNISRLFPVQSAVIPSILSAHSKPFPFKPRDICVSAPTGSGKTFAFGIPLIQLLMNRVECKIRALIILPVNELAVQVYKVLKQLANGTVLSICLLSKTFPFAKEQERLITFYKGEYFSKVDIIVTTPGRLVEHLHSTKGFCLKNLKFLIIDEADRIMEQIHFNWLYHLDEHVRKTSDEFFSGSVPPLCLYELMGALANQPHKMLFSATLSHDPEKLMSLKLFQPKLFTTVIQSIEELEKKLKENTNGNDTIGSKNEIRGEFIGKYAIPAELTEKYCLTEVRIKPLTIFALVKENKWKKFLCFTNSVDSAYRLSHVLCSLFSLTDTKNMKIDYLSATLTTKARSELLDKFTKVTHMGLVCSDALARGIDIPDVDVVFSYDVPRHIKTYIHRIGRTARAGRLGTAITLLPSNEINHFKKLLNNAGKTIGEEITIKSDIETENATIYTRALISLKKDLTVKKKMEQVKTKKMKNMPFGNDSQLTGFEKLQREINANFESKYIKDDEEQKVPRKFRKNKQIKTKSEKKKLKGSKETNNV